MAEGILINGKVHDWTDVKVHIMGQEFTGITSINWSAKKEKALQYAQGSAPLGIGYGHRSYTADFTMTFENAEKFEAIANAADGKDALDYAPFLITIAYADKEVLSNGILEPKWGVLHSTQLMDVDVTDISVSLDESTKRIVRKYSAVVGKIVSKL